MAKMDFGPASIDFWICRQSLRRVACEVNIRHGSMQLHQQHEIVDKIELKHIQNSVKQTGELTYCDALAHFVFASLAT